MGKAYGIFLIAVLVLAGCEQPEADPVGSSVPSKQAADRTETAVTNPANPLRVKITPDPPTADGCLQAVAAGAGDASYRWRVNGFDMSDHNEQSLCEGFASGDEVRVTVSLHQLSGTAGVTIVDAPPRITEVAVNVDAITDHGDLVIKVDTVDADQDYVELRYQWYVNGEPAPLLTEDTLPADRYRRGDAIRFTITPTDGVREGAVYRSNELTVPNAPPQIVSTLPERFESMAYSYHCQALDPDGDTVAYALEKAPAGMTVDPVTGVINWSLAGVKNGDYPVRVTARDPSGAVAFQEYTLTIGVPQ